MFFFALQATATDRYFSSSTGNDNNPGTIGQPYATLAKLSTITLSPGDKNYLKRGDQFVAPLNINQSGNSSAPIVFDAYGTGALPEVTGFMSLTTWTNQGGNIWQASLNAGSSLNMLTVNGVPTMRGRYPNSGWATIASHNGYVSISDPLNPSTGTNWTGAWITMRSLRFQINSYPIASHSGFTLTYNGSQDTMQREPIDGYGYFIQNDPRTLDIQNEWYYNPTSNYVRMYSTSNPSTLNVQAATKDFLCAANSRSYVTIQNIRFTGANNLLVNWNMGSNDTIRNCEFEYAGINGLYLNTLTNSAFVNNSIRNTNNLGLLMIPNCTNAYIAGNFIENTGLIPGYSLRETNGNQHGSGIFANGNGVKVKYNTIKRTCYAGVSITRDAFEISYNSIDSATMILDDVGGIYSSDAPLYGSDRIIAYNVVTNCWGNNAGAGNAPGPSEGAGIYDDELGSNAQILNNTLSGFGLYGINLHDLQNVVIKYNKVFDYHKYGIIIIKDALHPDVPIRNIVHKFNTYVSTTNRSTRDAEPNAPIQIVTDNDFSDLIQFGVSDSNTYINPFKSNIDDIIKASTATYTDSTYSLTAWQAKTGQDLHSIVSYANYYPAYTVTSAGANQFPSGNFNTQINNLLNEFPSTQTFSRDVTMMDTACLKVTYTGSNPTTNGLSVWLYDTNNMQDWPTGSYIVEFDIQNSINYEAQFFAVIRSANGSPSAPSQILSFKVEPYRTKVKLRFDLDHTVTNHYVVIYADKAGSAPIFWMDNFKAYPITASATDWHDYLDFKTAGASETIFATPKAYLNEKRQRQGLNKTIPSYSGEYFFTDGTLTRVKGVIRPAQ